MTQYWGRYVVVLLVCSIGVLSLAAEKSTKRSSKSTKSSVASQEQVSFRLPRYFSSLVDKEQRAEIYEIQADYQQKIEALEQELVELEMEQLKKIEGVLTSTQKKELASMREAGSKKSKSSGKPKSTSKSSSKNSTSKS